MEWLSQPVTEIYEKQIKQTNNNNKRTRVNSILTRSNSGISLQTITFDENDLHVFVAE